LAMVCGVGLYAQLRAEFDVLQLTVQAGIMLEARELVVKEGSELALCASASVSAPVARANDPARRQATAASAAAVFTERLLSPIMSFPPVFPIAFHPPVRKRRGRVDRAA
jgi:hypothetical protein